MKRTIIITLLIIFMSSAAFTREFVASGKTHSALGDYRIELADETVTVNGVELKTFVITYENSPMEVTVAIKDDPDCRNFIVLSDKLSVRYVCNEYYFGVEMLNEALQTDQGEFTTSVMNLNRSEYFHQKVISCEGKGEVENTQLIAAYFPMLLKNSEETLAAR
jgi:hypothetical protein